MSSKKKSSLLPLLVALPFVPPNPLDDVGLALEGLYNTEVIKGKGGYWVKGRGFITLAKARKFTGIKGKPREKRERQLPWGDYATVAMLNRPRKNPWDPTKEPYRVTITRYHPDLPYGWASESKSFPTLEAAKAYATNIPRERIRSDIVIDMAMNVSDWQRHGRWHRVERVRNPSLYQAFHGNPPKHVKKVHLPDIKRAVKIGRLKSLVYAPEAPSKRKGTEYSHAFGDYGYKFEKGQEPILAVSADGKQLILIGGKYFFGERGIIG